jgi:hypothetical protein
MLSSADPSMFEEYPEFSDALWCKLDDLSGKVRVSCIRTRLSRTALAKPQGEPVLSTSKSTARALADKRKQDKQDTLDVLLKE